MASPIPAVVVGAEVNGLGVIRALGRAGVPVFALSSDPKQPTARSRYCQAVRCRDERTEHIVESLIEFGREQDQRLPLFLTMDRTVSIVARHRVALDQYYLINLPDPDTVAELSDKQTIAALAKRQGISAPQTVMLKADHDLQTLDAALSFPVIVKPTRKTGHFDAHFGARALVLADPDTAIAKFKDYPWNDEPLLAQEFVDSPDSEIFFVLTYYRRPGEPLVQFTGRKIRSWPPRIGNTASAEPFSDDQPLRELATRFLDATGFSGLGSVEFKRSPDTGAYLLIEPTVGRTDYQSAIAPANGVNIPYVAYCDLLGLPVPAAEPATSLVKWMDTANDHRSALAAIGAVTLTESGYRDSIAPPRVETIYDRDDRGPWLFTYRQRGVGKIKRGLDRVFDRAPWLYPPFEGILPPEERWSPEHIKGALRQHRLPSPAYVRYFTRDPERRPPKKDRIVVSPADGVVRRIFEQEDRYIIDISMNFYDVHVQRIPLDGTITAIVDEGHPVERGSAEQQRYFDDPWAYESDYLFPVQKVTRIGTAIGEVVVRQITSIWAGRIASYVNIGDKVRIGERLGHIFLGSTVVLELPRSVTLTVEAQLAGRPRRRADRPIRGAETLVATY